MALLFKFVAELAIALSRGTMSHGRLVSLQEFNLPTYKGLHMFPAEDYF